MNEDSKTTKSALMELFTNWRLYFVLIVCVCVPLFCVWYFTDGAGNGAAKPELEQIVDTQRAVTEEIKSSASDTDRILAGVEGVAGGIDRIESGLDRTITEIEELRATEQDAGTIILECQAILRGARERTEKETARR